MKKLIVLGLLVLAGLIGYHFFAASMKGGQHGGGAPAAMPVSVAAVERKAVTEEQQFSGRLQAVNDAEIRPQVGGTIERILFKEGDEVKAGQPLFVLDGRTYKAALQEAQAGLTEAEAALERGKVLFAENAISRRDMETRAATYQRAAAAVATAKVNVDYSLIKAPIGGKIGRIDVTVGNVVAAGQMAVLTTIQSITPIYVDFDIDEQTYLKFVAMQRAAQGAKTIVRVGLANENDFPREGVLQSTDNRLDPTTGSLRARAVLDNLDGVLIPGLFARVRVGTPEPIEALLVNDNAVGTDQSKRFVYVVGADKKATYREVHLGGLAEGLRIVTDGVKPGEQVIVNGLMRIQPGAEVVPEVVNMRTLTSATTPAPSAGVTGAANEATTGMVSGTQAASSMQVSGTAPAAGAAETIE